MPFLNYYNFLPHIVPYFLGPPFYICEQGVTMYHFYNYYYSAATITAARIITTLPQSMLLLPPRLSLPRL